MAFIQLVAPIYFNVLQYGAVGNGSTDDTSAIQTTINAAAAISGGAVYFPPATYAISAPLNITTTNLSLIGCGHASIIQPLNAFSGSSYISISGADRGLVSGLSFWGSNFTSTSNPAGDGIQLHGSGDWIFHNLHFRSQNGYAIQIVGDNASDGTSFIFLSNCNARHCLAGYRVYSPNTANTTAGGILFTNCQADACQGGDAYLFQDCRDITMVGSQGYSNTGSSIHIKGGQFIHIDTMDLGGGTPSAACVLIEAGVLTPAKVLIGHTLCQKGTSGIEISSGNDIIIDHCSIYFNQTHGILIDNSGNVANVKIDSCTFDGNNQNNIANTYDLENLSTVGNIFVKGCQFKTINGSGVGKTAAGADSTSTGVFQGNQFLGGTPFSANLPSVAKDNAGYNPQGHVSAPSIPTSGVAFTNPFPYDCFVYVNGGTYTGSTSIDGNSTGIQNGQFLLPVGKTITLNYSSSPTWHWTGL